MRRQRPFRYEGQQWENICAGIRSLYTNHNSPTVVDNWAILPDGTRIEFDSNEEAWRELDRRYYRNDLSLLPR